MMAVSIKTITKTHVSAKCNASVLVGTRQEASYIDQWSNYKRALLMLLTSDIS